MPSVIFIVPNLTFGGIQTQVYYLARYLRLAYGFKVVIYGFLTRDSQYTALLDEVGIQHKFRPKLGKRIWSYESKGIFGKSLTWFLLWSFLIRQGRVVLLPYTKNLDTFINPLVSFTLIRGTFSFERGGHVNPRKQSNSLINRLKRKANPIYVANSFHGKRAIHLMKGVPLDQISVIPNGIDLRKFSACSRSETGPLVITMVANYFPEKEHEFVLQAWSKMSQKLQSQVRLKLVGLGGGDMCVTNFEKARLLSEQLGLKANVEFIETTNDVVDLLKKSDIGLLATKSEGCPNVILEYMAMGLPIVASKIPGIEEIISDQNREYLFERGDEVAFISKLDILVNNRHIRKELSAANRLHVCNNFSIEKMGEAYIGLLRKFNLY